MKFLHISDLHLGLKLFNRDLSEDLRYVLSQIIEQAAELQLDAVLIAGDIYDKAVPSAEAVELFDWFMQSLSDAAPEAELMLISGNHDSAPRVNLYRGILARHNIHMIGMPPETEEDHVERVTLQDAFGPVNFYLLPFVKPSMVKAVVGTDESGNNLSYDASVRALLDREKIDQSVRNVLVSHQFYLPAGDSAEQVERAESEIRSVGNIDQIGADVLDRFDYAALGHIHKPWKLDEFHRYCGTPLATSISEAGQKKGTVLVEMGPKGEISTQVLTLFPLHEVRVIEDTMENALKQSSDDYVRIVLTDRADQNAADAQERLRYAFPNLLEIRRDQQRTADYNMTVTEDAERDPFTLCMNFLQDLDEEEQAVLRDVINTVKGVQ